MLSASSMSTYLGSGRTQRTTAPGRVHPTVTESGIEGHIDECSAVVIRMRVHFLPGGALPTFVGSLYLEGQGEGVLVEEGETLLNLSLQ